MAEHAYTNRLADETSPYLQQHAHNPVDWWPWSPAALAEARDSDRPILLSVGYSACHWCHVMERESFEDTATAELMNRHFVCIKVDREERPDIDHIYMQAVQAMAGHGGWPMTVFLTPAGAPFYGGTYFPPRDRQGMPGFPRILSSVAQAWQANRGQVEEQGAALVEALAADHPPRQAEALPPELLDTAVASMGESFDREVGGFGMAPKFPQAPALDLLLRAAGLTGSRPAIAMLAAGLDAMARGGIRDQVGGGFHRYSVDRHWLVPHFEKMLSDNAQLARIYLQAGLLLDNRAYLEVATSTLDYILRDMTHPSGAIHASEDADSEGEEGRFYTWTREQVEEALGPDAPAACEAFGITQRGNWEGTNVLTEAGDGQDAAASAALGAKLLQARAARVRPARDEKIITSWNALAMAAFADAGIALGRDDYLQAARSNAAFLVGEMTEADGDQPLLVRHTARFVRHENSVHPTSQSERLVVSASPGFLEDYAALACGLLRLHAACGEPEWLEWAARLMDAALARFLGGDGMLYDTDAAADPLIARPRDIQDSATPAGTSLACEVLLDLAAITGSDRYRSVAKTILSTLAPVASGYATAFGRLLCAASRLVAPGRQLAIVGEPGTPAVDDLLAAAASRYRPDLVVAVAPHDYAPAAAWGLFGGRLKPTARATAYLCRGNECLLPITSPDALRAALDGGLAGQ